MSLSLLSHPRLWSAIDDLARRHGLSASGLAKAAGLDPTAFNKSKRVTAEGRPRWPSTESLARVLEATGASLDEFVMLVEGRGAPKPRGVPLIGLAQAGGGGYFDDAGFPVGGGWDEVSFPDVPDENAYALEVSGDSMAPVYRDGDVIVVSPAAAVRRGDRVVVKTMAGEVMAKVLARRTAKSVELASLNPAYEPRVLKPDEILWMARIIWASQ
ncbi:MAG: helix-turn-helix transcriptional regulator [Parvibaculum sp.]|jgi:phage repressor protein C with HTH and peptisase S24 domain|uniref:S24 family peptidase n=1 Tax=Parvibaculum sp. TaxID=2024848 RepID=UPI000DCD5783|nr:helix-turn-helix transcriptional regulator [Parvibaculum sp.]MDR3498863.1 helix-turn-helix transcriptional regulator [Parvibaculum sp.]RAV89531.1 helix-turn-helix transcriptional regulator [Aerococcus mictus]